jgi:hypothetical protein
LSSLFSFSSLSFKGIKIANIESNLKKKLVFPSHFQVSFYGDYLDSFPISSEISIPSLQKLQYQDMNWSSRDLPRCCSPLNLTPLIKNRRLVVLVWLTNELCNQEVIGQANLKLEILNETDQSKEESKRNEKQANQEQQQFSSKRMTLQAKF